MNRECRSFCGILFLDRMVMEVITLSGIGEIKVRRGANIKYLRIHMAPARGVWVTVPFGVSRKQVEKFLEENRAWILDNRKQMEQYEQDTGVGLQIGAEIQTKFHLLKVVATEEDKPTYRMEDKTIVLSVPQKVEFKRVEKFVQQFLVEIYALESKQYLPGRVRYWAEKCGFSYGKLSFRNNVSNWGSCSFENHISLNIKLMKLPDEVIDYVILHELCHTVEKNHSPAFWKLMGKVCPDYAGLRNRLKGYHTRI